MLVPQILPLTQSSADMLWVRSGQARHRCITVQNINGGVGGQLCHPQYAEWSSDFAARQVNPICKKASKRREITKY